MALCLSGISILRFLFLELWNPFQQKKKGSVTLCVRHVAGRVIPIPRARCPAVWCPQSPGFSFVQTEQWRCFHCPRPASTLTTRGVRPRCEIEIAVLLQGQLFKSWSAAGAPELLSFSRGESGRPLHPCRGARPGRAGGLAQAREQAETGSESRRDGRGPPRLPAVLWPLSGPSVRLAGLGQCRELCGHCG